MSSSKTTHPNNMNDTQPSADESHPAALDATSVAQYLAEHPDFFTEHPEALTPLITDNDSSISSLAQRQLSSLNKKNQLLNNTLNDLLEQGRRNDILFEKTATFIERLLNCHQLSDLKACVQNELATLFELTLVKLHLFNHNAESDTPADLRQQLHTYFPSLLEDQANISGQLRDHEWTLLFKQTKINSASATVIPLRDNQQTIGILCLAGEHDHGFNPEADTLFIKHIAHIITNLLQRIA